MIDNYYTIDSPQNAEIKIKGSKFIGYVFPVSNKEIAILKLHEIKVKHFDATHNCFAYKIWNSNEYRTSDDGEPSGTAGTPILLTIKKYDFNDILVVVTRYFGGTKLGVGGLVRAYTKSAESVLELCEKKIVNITNAVLVNCRYEEISLVKRIINEYAVSFAEEYTDVVRITAQIPLSKTDNFISTITYSTNAKASAIII
ncbi:MAG: IMPACT family protein [Bacteroidetes bacterium]|nr:IMPACT family protein [Bacteroidota bacterium]